MMISMSLPMPPPETIFLDGLPFGAMEALKAAYGSLVQMLDPPKDGYNLTMKLNLSKLPSDEGSTSFFFLKVILSLPCSKVKTVGGISLSLYMLHPQQLCFSCKNTHAMHEK